MRKYILASGLIALALVAAGCGRNNENSSEGSVPATESITESVTESEKDAESAEESIAETESQSTVETVTEMQSTAETESTSVSYGRADGTYDVDLMNEMRSAYETMASQLLEYEAFGTVTNVRVTEAEQKEGDNIVVCSGEGIAIYRDYSAKDSDECVLEWGDNSYTLAGVKDWSGFPAQHMKFIELDTDGDGENELIVNSEIGARGSNAFCFIDIVDGEALCDFYDYSPQLEEYGVYDDFIITYRLNGMNETAVKDARDYIKRERWYGLDDRTDYYIGEAGWWNEAGELLENPYINLMAGCTYEYDFYNDMREGEGGCIIRIGKDINLETMSGPEIETYSYYKFKDGRLELLGRR